MSVGSTGLRAGVVGTGFIGAVHVDALRRLGVEVVGVVGSSPERAQAKGLGRFWQHRFRKKNDWLPGLDSNQRPFD